MDLLDEIISTVSSGSKKEARKKLSELLKARGVYQVGAAPSLNSKPTRVLKDLVQ